MNNPMLRECAGQIARRFHETGVRKTRERGLETPPGWDEMPELVRSLATETFYSLLYSGTICCTLREHRIGISLRSEPDGPVAYGEGLIAGQRAERERIAREIDPAMLDKLADWFDTDDEFKTTMFPETWPERGREVQDDLRRWANLLREQT